MARWLFIILYLVGSAAVLLAALTGNGAALLLVPALALASPVVRAIS